MQSNFIRFYFKTHFDHIIGKPSARYIQKRILFKTYSINLTFSRFCIPVFESLLTSPKTVSVTKWKSSKAVLYPSLFEVKMKWSENIFLMINLHCMRVKMKEKKLLGRLYPTFTPSIKQIQADHAMDIILLKLIQYQRQN